MQQTYVDFELIIVNDGSTDHSMEELDKYDDPRIKVFTQENSGVSAARNKGIELATNEWIAFIDADDLWLPEHLEEIAKLNKVYPEAAMLATTTIEQASNVTLPFKESVDHNYEIRHIDYFLEASLNISVIHTSNVAIKKIVLEDVGVFSNYKRGEDLELWARIALNNKVVKSNRKTSIYVKGTGGLMDTGIHSLDKLSSVGLIRLQDFTPSAFYLKNKLCELKDFQQIKSVRKYINSRILNHIRGNLIRHEFDIAKNLGEHLVNPNPTPEFVYFYLSKMPSPLLNMLFKLRSFLRNMIRSLI